MTPEEITAQMVDALSDRLIDKRVRGDGSLEFIVGPEALRDAAVTLLRSGVDRLDFVTAIDWRDRFDLVYQLYSFRDKTNVRLRASVGRDGETVASVADLWPVANWEEREVYDQFGITFDGHPDLARILNPDDWKGHPLRKDYEDPDVIKRPDYF